MSLKTRRLVILISVISLLFVLILNFFVLQKSEEEKYFESIQTKIHKVNSQFDEDFIRVLMDVRPEDSITFEHVSNPNHIHPFFILNTSGKLLFWSDFTTTLDFSSLDFNQEFQLLEDPFGTFFVKIRKIKRATTDYYLVHALRLIWPGSIENDYLKTGPNPDFFGNDRFQLFENPADGTFQVSSNSGKPIFGISFQVGYEPVGRVSNTPLLIFICSIFLLYFILSFDFLRKKWKNGYPWQTIGYGFLILFTIRISMLLLDFPGEFFETSLFDPANYASSWLNPSLGDLFFNTLCLGFILGLIIFQFASKKAFQQVVILKNDKKFRLALIFSLLMSTFFFSLVWFLPRDLIFNSQWVLDIRSIPTFDLFKGLSILILFLWGSVYVLLSLNLFSLLLSVKKEKQIYYRYLSGIGFPLLLVAGYYSFWLGVAGLIHLFFLFSIIRFELYQNVFRLGLDTFLTFFYACLVTAGIIGVSTFQSERERLILSKTRFANQNLIENDVMTEFFLGDIFSRVKNDLFILNRMADPLLSKDPIETKIRKIYLDNYFDQFEVVIRIFSASGQQTQGPPEGQDLKTLRQQYVKSDFATGVRDLYFIRGKETIASNKFVAFVPVLREDNLQGTLYLELNQLRIQPGSVYPKLLLDRKYAEKLDPLNYDYAVLRDKELLRSSGTFNYNQPDFLTILDRNQIFQSGILVQGFHHFGLKNGEEVIILSSPTISISQFFGNISLFFVAFVFLTFLAILLNTLFKGYRNFEFNYSTKLQLYLNFAFFFPIIIISIITIGLLGGSYKDDLNRQYIEKARLIRSNLGEFFNNQNPASIDRDLLNEEINTLANTIASDIHLYAPNGYLESSNRSNIFDKKILSPWINPLAMSGIMEKNQIQLLADEKIGKLKYQTVYLAVPSQIDQSNIGILAVPFFESETELNSLISVVLSNIFNAFVVIFILFLIVSSFVSKNLTLPFKLLTQKLKATNLENNEPMYWGSKDEIGLLVNEYNNMLFKLEASKKVLASTEKESAWREMAKQVAHEIKNPLTPMKLTLQHLLRLDQEGKLDDQQKLRKSLETLIHQVDALSGIASSFSTFAKMPLPKNELMNFKTVLMQVLELFKNDKRVKIDFLDDSYTEEIIIMGDDKLFGRVIANLIINGIQAMEQGKFPHIKIWLWMTEQSVFLEIADNGKGIPQELKDKIFIPNFSTKSTGSGLGLAIAKSGVETAGGKIWFETEEGKGTTFYLTFPLVE
ncbi:His Kinase A (phospho-acceptor) domain-containing protein [Algoriphagus alkaliphilus]|uniref:histidine kinase n=1 Tax=Algoriphagus alkaliphilus TaxID=279824 RepID=A0A1G5W9W6_9BACT|nr:HAMP domain-containing sensor histidine kinase [Algoriphagus alkaliphilus]SDA54880.1 His Kinase A (phospho-acceptor) domain-containing protein [Algoriphagus alkaliphilus]